MTLYWIGDAVLALVVVPVVLVLLRGVLGEARSIVPSVNRIKAAARPPGRRTSTPRRCC